MSDKRLALYAVLYLLAGIVVAFLIPIPPHPMPADPAGASAPTQKKGPQ